MEAPPQPRPVDSSPPQAMDGDNLIAACAGIMNAVFCGDEKQTDHAAAVAAMAAQMGGDPEAVAAAYLHDVAEDATPDGESPADFLRRLGVPERVARIVLVVTRHVNGRESYEEFINRIVWHDGPERDDAVAVKHADLLVNRARCIGKPGFERLLRRYETALRRFDKPDDFAFVVRDEWLAEQGKTLGLEADDGRGYNFEAARWAHMDAEKAGRGRSMVEAAMDAAEQNFVDYCQFRRANCALETNSLRDAYVIFGYRPDIKPARFWERTA